MTVLHLVRHGVTSDTGRRLSGRTPGIHLSDEGRRQAEAAGSHLAGIRFKAIYSSPIERCFETAEIVARPHGIEVERLEGIIEVDYGSWSNRTFPSLKRSKLWASVQRWPSSVRFPGGETIRQVQTRTVDALQELSARHPKDHIACVTHADVIRLAMAHFLGVHVDLYQRIVVGPASVSVLHIGSEGPHVLGLNQQPVPLEGHDEGTEGRG